MFKPKRIIVSFSSGFVLSFLISIISTKRFGPSILRAFIFGFVFALVALGISYVWKKFLDGDSASVESPRASSGEKTSGGHVDITLTDEGLSDDGTQLRFSVANNKQKLQTDELPKSEPRASENLFTPTSVQSRPVASVAEQEKTEASDKKPEFKPVNLGEKIDTFPSHEDSGESKKSARSLSREADIKEVEQLPDISDFQSLAGGDSVSMDGAGGMEGGEAIDVSFSDDSDVTSASIEFGRNVAESSKSHDVETIAKALSTVLKREDD